MTDYDLLISAVVTSAELETGVPRAVVQSRSSVPLACVGSSKLGEQGKSPDWTEEENDYLRQNLGFISEEEMAEHLGRTVVGVHLHWKRDLRLPAPSKNPNYLTANQVAKLIGEDAHKVCSWIDRGLLPGESVPGFRRIRRVNKALLMEWLTNPDNWVWFDTKKARDPNLRRMLDDAKQAWGDEWWTSKQVAEYHSVTCNDVCRYIKAGKIAAVHAVHKGGRDKGGWAFWFIKKSEATRPDLVFVRIKKNRK